MDDLRITTKGICELLKDDCYLGWVISKNPPRFTIDGKKYFQAGEIVEFVDYWRLTLNKLNIVKEIPEAIAVTSVTKMENLSYIDIIKALSKLYIPCALRTYGDGVERDFEFARSDIKRVVDHIKA